MGPTSRGVECRRCGARILAPEFSDYAGEAGTVCHLWRCPKCHYEFDTQVVPDVNAPLSLDLVERFLPALLII
jgi:hypothetical protein